MIEVRARPEYIMVTGHARYAEPGKDIVCAGVTALVQALEKSISGLTRDRPQQEIVDGKFYMRTENLSEQGRLLVDSFFIGICRIADDFPGYVRVV